MTIHACSSAVCRDLLLRRSSALLLEPRKSVSTEIDSKKYDLRLTTNSNGENGDLTMVRLN